MISWDFKTSAQHADLALGEKSPVVSLADHQIFDTGIGGEQNPSRSFSLVNALTLCSIFTQSSIGTCMVNEALQQIILFMVEILLPFACGCIGVEFGFSTECLIKTSQHIYMQ